VFIYTSHRQLLSLAADVVRGAPSEGPMRERIPVADLTAGLFCAISKLTEKVPRLLGQRAERCRRARGAIYSIDQMFEATRSGISGSPQKGEVITRTATSAWSVSPSRCRVRRANIPLPPEFGEQTDEVCGI
jgi:hypothetical protein